MKCLSVGIAVHRIRVDWGPPCGRGAARTTGNSQRDYLAVGDLEVGPLEVGYRAAAS
ncbi:MAG: hypothetical protein JWO01_1759 [Microbacteriaceae bacterium]|nr:hypothetical protein [Microbacteriaceae bacterium]